MNKWMKFLHRDSRMQEDVHDGPLIKLENLVKIYDTGAIKVLGLKKINLTIERGELAFSVSFPFSSNRMAVSSKRLSL